MTWEDIDIVVTTDPKYEDYLELVSYIFPKENIYSMNLQDFRKSIYPDRPQGIYCGVKYLQKPDIFWKIDVWFLPEGHDNAEQQMSWVQKQLNEENRATILKIKNEMREKMKGGKAISGKDVYDAVHKLHGILEEKNLIFYEWSSFQT